jgi:uncharacterized protein (TIGR02391 family)
MANEPPFEQETLKAISKVLGDTSQGLTGSEIGHLLATCKAQDVDATNTKWKRLYNALAANQNKRKNGNLVIGSIHYAMKPVRWKDKQDEFHFLLDELDKVLGFAGYTILEDGGVRRSSKVTTLTQAEARAKTLHTKLTSRNVHSDVLRFCKAELLQQNYFHAVLEATKSVANKIRSKSGLTCDGAQLAQEALSIGRPGSPKIAINQLMTETERGEQRGFTNLVVGLFGTFRNPAAHAEKIYWPINEQDALDILSMVSLVHRKLDGASS